MRPSIFRRLVRDVAGDVGKAPMTLNIHVTVHRKEDPEAITVLDKILLRLGALDRHVAELKELITMNAAELQAKLDAVLEKQTQTGTAITNIAEDIRRIKESIPTSGGLTEAEAQALSATLDTVLANADALATAATALDAENT